MHKILEAILKGILMGLEIQDDELDLKVFQKSEVTSDYHADRVKKMKFIKENFVDLDLPSGTLWCKFNIGATNGDTPKSWYGNYYAWGEIQPKRKYTWDTYKLYGDDIDSFAKYNEDDGKQVLDPEDDVVSVTLGKDFKMPTTEDFKELCALSHNWVENYNGVNGLNGRIFTGNNGDTLFMPAAGYRNICKSYYTDVDCSLWSSSIYFNSPSSAVCMYLDSDYGFPVFNSLRYYGRPVRGIIKK